MAEKLGMLTNRANQPSPVQPCPANESQYQSLNWSVNRANPWIKQWINQSVNPWINRPINQSIKSINQSLNQSIKQSINQSINQSIYPTRIDSPHRSQSDRQAFSWQMPQHAIYRRSPNMALRGKQELRIIALVQTLCILVLVWQHRCLGPLGILLFSASNLL